MTDIEENVPSEDRQANREEMPDWVDDPVVVEQNEAEQNHSNIESNLTVEDDGETDREGGQPTSVPATLSEDPTTISARRQDRDLDTNDPLTRLTIGSALLAIDTLAERIEEAKNEEADQSLHRRPEDVLIPMSEWSDRFGEPGKREARYLMLGVMADARSSAHRGGTLLRKVSESTANMITAVFSPISKSKHFRPITKRFDSVVNRGESQVKHWVDLGRHEDFRSRRLAETAINRAADDSMDVLVENKRVALFIQEIVQAQSQGMIDEGIEELRERVLSSDIFLERPIRQLLRKTSRNSIPAPDFDPSLLLSKRRRQLPIQEDSLLGYYAGFVSRLFAFALDVVLLTVFLAVGSWFLSTAMQIFGVLDFYETLFQSTSIGNTVAVAWAGLSGFVVVGGYIMAFWILTGQTFGMMIMGIRVVATDGDRLTFWQALRRLIGLFISAITFFIGFIWILFDNRRQGWPDKIGGTFIVYAWDARPDETFLTDYMFRQY